MAEFALPASAPYPVRYEVDYPERQSRWKAIFRLPLSIPVLLFSWLLSYALYGSLWLLWIIILLRGRIPRWLFDFYVGVSRGIARANAYFSLLTDVYPPFDGPHPVRLEITYPQRVSRWKLVVWKLITSVPHFLAMEILQSASLAILPIAWIAIIFSGRYPKGLHDFAVGVQRWQQRVRAYLLSLTDEFPPFSIAADAGAGSGRALAFSAVLGVGLTAAAVAGITALVVTDWGNDEHRVSVSYQRLVDGRALPGETTVFGDGMVISLKRVRDPADALLPFLEADEGKRLVGFEMSIRDTKDRTLIIEEWDFRLDDSNGDSHHSFLALANKRPLPERVKGEEAAVELVFEVDADAVPTELHYNATARLLKTLVYAFE